MNVPIEPRSVARGIGRRALLMGRASLKTGDTFTFGMLAPAWSIGPNPLLDKYPPSFLALVLSKSYILSTLIGLCRCPGFLAKDSGMDPKPNPDANHQIHDQDSTAFHGISPWWAWQQAGFRQGLWKNSTKTNLS